MTRPVERGMTALYLTLASDWLRARHGLVQYLRPCVVKVPLGTRQALGRLDCQPRRGTVCHRPRVQALRIPHPLSAGHMDIIFIERLHIDTIIGIYDWERQVRQTVTLDLEMGWDNTRPANTDAIEDALNYKAVAKRLTAFVEASSFSLVETMAERCAAIVREEFGVPWVRLRLRKLRAVRGSKAVGVEIERGSRSPVA